MIVMEAIIHHNIEVLRDIIPKWKQLKNEFCEITIFQDVEWLMSWWEHKSKDHKISPYILDIKKDEQTVGVIPLYIAQKDFAHLRFRILRPIGLVEADSLIPILSKGFSSNDILKTALGKLYEDKHNWDCIQWGDLPEKTILDYYLNSNHFEKKKMIYRKKTSFTPKLIMNDELEKIMGKINKKFLKDVQYDDRKMKREGALKFNIVKKDAEIGPIMRVFFDLHRKRWKNTATPSIFERKSEEDFFMELARKFHVNQLLYLAYITYNDDIIAVNFGMSDGETNWLFRHAINMKYRKFSIGHLLAYYIILNSYNDNYKVIDFLRGGEEFKQKWGTVNDINIEYLIFNNSRKSLLFRYIMNTYYSDGFEKKPLYKQVMAKTIIRGCALLFRQN